MRLKGCVKFMFSSMSTLCAEKMPKQLRDINENERTMSKMLHCNTRNLKDNFLVMLHQTETTITMTINCGTDAKTFFDLLIIH